MSRNRRPLGWHAAPTGRLGFMAGCLSCLIAAGALSAQVPQKPPEDRPERRPRDVPTLERPTAEQADHEVRPGDTLWDLAGRYLRDPFRWREIYRMNTSVVEDPHWIFPGEVLRIPSRPTEWGESPARPAGGARRADSPGGAPARETPHAGRGQEARSGRRGVSAFGGTSVFDRSPNSQDVLGELTVTERRPTALVSRSDYYRASFLAREGELEPLGVSARKLEENPLRLTLPPSLRVHDRVLVALHGLRVEKGTLLEAFRWGKRVESGERIADPMALLQVSRVQGDSARAVVTQLFSNYRVGDPLMTVEDFHGTPPQELEPVEDGLVTRIVGFAVEQALIGRGDFVFLGAGSESGVNVGDSFVVFTASEPHPATAPWEDRLAVVRVVRLRAHTSTAMVIQLVDTGAEAGAPARRVARAAGGR
ncbi:MAG: LysM peptidoglycan-binding domain-containing protein [Gemmatimonadota bacterium]